MKWSLEKTRARARETPTPPTPTFSTTSSSFVRSSSFVEAARAFSLSVLLLLLLLQAKRAQAKMCRQNRFLFSFGKIPFVFVFSSSLSNRVFRVYYFWIFRVSTKLLSLFFSFCSFSFSLEGKKRHQKKSGRGALLLRKTTVLWHFDFERESESESERETPARVERVVWREKVLSFSFFCVFRGETRVLFVLSVFGYRIRESDWTAKKKSAAPFSFFRFVSRRLRRRL